MRGSNPSSIKNDNRRVVLDIIRKGNATRTSIATEAGLTRGGLSPIIAELLAQKLIVEKETVEVGHGRPQVLLTLNGQYAKLISVEWVRDQLSVTLAGIDGTIQSYWHYGIRGDERADDIMEMMAEQMEHLIRQEIESLLLGIIVQVPGPLDAERGVILRPSYFNGWHDIAVADALRARFNLPVVVENNLVGYTMAERYLGHGREHRHFISLLVDEGIGAGLIENGRIYQGQSRQISEIGHISLDINGPQCSCGNFGCAELYANVPAMCRIAFGDDCNRGGRNWRKPMRDLAEGCSRGDSRCMAAIAHEVKYLGSAIVTLVNAFDIDVVVIGGTLTLAENYLQVPLHDYIAPKIASKSLLHPTLHFSHIENATLVGGAFHLFNLFLQGQLGNYDEIVARSRSPFVG